ncbi:MAG: S1C family serine protease [Alphaproteobacteria bacterium]
MALILFVAPDRAAAQIRAPGESRMQDAVRAVVGVAAEIPSGARSAQSLGTERQGSGVIIGSDGLILTVGYLLLEATRVVITAPSGDEVEARIVAYDYDTGFGLLRAKFTERVKAIELANPKDLKPGDQVYIASRVADLDVTPATFIARREFAGYWEYLLPEAIFTTPQYAAFGGAPLLSADGRLLGIGSLAVRNAAGENIHSPGNMFIPIDQLPPILGDLLALGRRSGKEKPWLGIWSSEGEQGEVSIGGVQPDSPASRAGLRRGDVIVKVEGQAVAGQADLYKKLWAAGENAPEIALTLKRGGDTVEQKVQAIGRSAFFRMSGDEKK